MQALWDVTQQFNNKNGSILVSGKIYVYFRGRTELATTYSDVEGTRVNSNPILLDNNGRASCYVDAICSYTIVVCDSYGRELFSQDITLPDTESILPDIREELQELNEAVDRHTSQISDLDTEVDTLSDSKKDKQTPVDLSSGSTKKTVTRVQQNENGVITVTYQDIDFSDVPKVEITSPNNTLDINATYDSTTNTKTFEIDVNSKEAKYWQGTVSTFLLSSSSSTKNLFESMSKLRGQGIDPLSSGGLSEGLYLVTCSFDIKSITQPQENISVSFNCYGYNVSFIVDSQSNTTHEFSQLIWCNSNTLNMSVSSTISNVLNVKCNNFAIYKVEGIIDGAGSGLDVVTHDSTLSGGGTVDSPLSVAVQSDWSESSTSAASYIKNKPTLPLTVTDDTPWDTIRDYYMQGVPILYKSDFTVNSQIFVLGGYDDSNKYFEFYNISVTRPDDGNQSYDVYTRNSTYTQSVRLYRDGRKINNLAVSSLDVRDLPFTFYYQDVNQYNTHTQNVWGKAYNTLKDDHRPVFLMYGTIPLYATSYSGTTIRFTGFEYSYNLNYAFMYTCTFTSGQAIGSVQATSIYKSEYVNALLNEKQNKLPTQQSTITETYSINVDGTSEASTRVYQEYDNTKSNAAVLLSDDDTSTTSGHRKAYYDTALKYTSSTNTLTANVSGNAATATESGKVALKEIGITSINLNDCTANDGFVHFYGWSTTNKGRVQNKPYDNAGTVEVIPQGMGSYGNYTIQKCYIRGRDTIYVRRLSDGSWSSWREI